jgi:hypothetical protein
MSEKCPPFIYASSPCDSRISSYDFPTFSIPFLNQVRIPIAMHHHILTVVTFFDSQHQAVDRVATKGVPVPVQRTQSRATDGSGAVRAGLSSVFVLVCLSSLLMPCVRGCCLYEATIESRYCGTTVAFPNCQPVLVSIVPISDMS